MQQATAMWKDRLNVHPTYFPQGSIPLRRQKKAGVLRDGPWWLEVGLAAPQSRWKLLDWQPAVVRTSPLIGFNFTANRIAEIADVVEGGSEREICPQLWRRRS